MPNRKIVTSFARTWPRELFEGPKRPNWAVGVSEPLDFPGVYVLYRDEHPYYVGQTKGKLYSRIWHHANKPQARYFSFWNFVSAFVVPEPSHVDEVEALLNHDDDYREQGNAKDQAHHVSSTSLEEDSRDGSTPVGAMKCDTVQQALSLTPSLSPFGRSVRRGERRRYAP